MHSSFEFSRVCRMQRCDLHFNAIDSNDNLYIYLFIMLLNQNSVKIALLHLWNLGTDKHKMHKWDSTSNSLFPVHCSFVKVACLHLGGHGFSSHSRWPRLVLLPFSSSFHLLCFGFVVDEQWTCTFIFISQICKAMSVKFLIFFCPRVGSEAYVAHDTGGYHARTYNSLRCD